MQRLPEGARGLTLTVAPAAAALPLVVVGVVISWWAWERGGFFDTVFIPGALVLAGLLITLLAAARWPARLTGWGRAALLALVGLSAWTLASALWSPTPAVALADAQRALAYALAFGLGGWLCLLLGRRMLLSLAPVAVSGALVGVGALIALWVGEDSMQVFEGDAAVGYPLGYRSAEAAFFSVALWPMVVLAAAREIDWRARGALVGAATLVIELAVLTQSRPALLAVALGAVVLIATHPAKLRMVGYLVLAGAPAAIALPWLLDVFEADRRGSAAALESLHTACLVVAVTSAASATLGLIAARTNPTVSRRVRRGIGGALLAALAVAVGLSVVALTRAGEGPAWFVDDPLEHSSGLGREDTRSGSDQRSDLWRVALDELEASPLEGTGAGGFRAAYLLDRSSNDVQPEDPHSAEMLMGSELGVVGLVLFAVFASAAAGGALRSRRLGPSAASLSAGALALGACWLAQASVDWLWHYPAVTLPVAFALGAAAAPAMLDPGVERRRLSRLALGAVAVSLALASIPAWFSEHYTREALRSGTDDAAAAYEDLDRAASLNPLSDRPLLAEAIVAERAGETQRALAALSEAKDRTPSEWALYYLEARLLQDSNPAGARTALERARRLNPIGEEVLEPHDSFVREGTESGGVQPAAAQSPLDDPSSAQYESPLPSQDDAESGASESWGVDERIGSLPLTGIDLVLVVGVALLLTGTGLALRRFSAPPDPRS